MKKRALAILISGAIGFSSCNYNSIVKQNEKMLKSSYSMCSDGEFDLDKRCIKSYDTIENLVNSSYVLRTRAHYDIPKNVPESTKRYFNKITNENGTLISQGTAFTWRGDKFLTADHCIDKAKPVRISWTQTLNPKSKASYFVLINGKEYETKVLKKIDDGIDAALIKLKNSPKTFPNFKVADITKMKPGHLVYQVGNMEGDGIQLKRGIISRVKRSTIFDYYSKKDLKEKDFKGAHFMMDLTINGGDSGSPVYLIKDGKPELAGIVTKGKAKTNFILRIDDIIKSLDLEIDEGLRRHYYDMKKNIINE